MTWDPRSHEGDIIPSAFTPGISLLRLAYEDGGRLALSIELRAQLMRRVAGLARSPREVAMLRTWVEQRHAELFPKLAQVAENGSWRDQRFLPEPTPGAMDIQARVAWRRRRAEARALKAAQQQARRDARRRAAMERLRAKDAA
jgi:hypothetical protein